MGVFAASRQSSPANCTLRQWGRRQSGHWPHCSGCSRSRPPATKAQNESVIHSGTGPSCSRRQRRRRRRMLAQWPRSRRTGGCGSCWSWSSSSCWRTRGICRAWRSRSTWTTRGSSRTWRICSTGARPSTSTTSATRTRSTSWRCFSSRSSGPSCTRPRLSIRCITTSTGIGSTSGRTGRWNATRKAQPHDTTHHL